MRKELSGTIYLATEIEALSGKAGSTPLHSQGKRQRKAVGNPGHRGQVSSSSLCEAEWDQRKGISGKGKRVV